MGLNTFVLTIPQVQAAPKKAPKKKTQEAESVEPKGVLDLTSEKMADMLKAAAIARQQSIKLKGVEYAQGLKSELLTFAEALETKFTELQDAVREKREDNAKKLLREVAVIEEAGEKKKAGLVQRNFQCPQGSVIIKITGFTFKKTWLWIRVNCLMPLNPFESFSPNKHAVLHAGCSISVSATSEATQSKGKQ